MNRSARFIGWSRPLALVAGVVLGFALVEWLKRGFED